MQQYSFQSKLPTFQAMSMLLVPTARKLCDCIVLLAGIGRGLRLYARHVVPGLASRLARRLGAFFPCNVARLGEDMPMGLKLGTVEQLKKHLEMLRTRQ